jgi:uncharacterized protein YuzE
MMITTYDAEADATYVRILPKGVAVIDTLEIEPGVLLDHDAEGPVVGIEVLGVRARSAACSGAV